MAGVEPRWLNITWQVALVTTFQTLPYLLLGLPAGAWVDRMRRRPVLITGDFGRAAILGSVPFATALGALTLGHLYMVALASGVLTLFSPEVAHQDLRREIGEGLRVTVQVVGGS
jgi:MFS family permease